MSSYSRQIKALLVRKLKIILRTKGIFFRLIFPVIMFDGLAIMLYFKSKSGLVSDSNPVTVTLENFSKYEPSIAFIYNNIPQTDESITKITSSLLDVISEEMDVTPDVKPFTSFDDFYNWTYTMKKENGPKMNLIMALGFSPTNEATTLNLTVFYNGSSFTSDSPFYYIVSTEKAIWKASNLGTYTYSMIHIPDDFSISVLSSVIAYMLLFGMVMTTMVFILHAIEDIKHEKRDFLLTSNLKLTSYWIATFVVDFACLFAVSFLSWILLIAIGIKSKGFSFYTIFFNNISIILFSYVISFLFDNAQAGSSIGMNLQIILVAIFMVADILRFGKQEVLFSYIAAILPQSNGYLSLCKAISLPDISLKTIFQTQSLFPLALFNLLNPFIYCGILALVEWARKKIQAKRAMSSFPAYAQLFQDRKLLHDITTEAKMMEEEVRSGQHSYDICVRDVSRLFLDGNKLPVCAVNNVSLGIQHGEIFGFLGANGAGKSTLMKMITGSLPVSSGTISICDQTVAAALKKQLVSICPQANTHLTPELTVREQLRLISDMYNLDPVETERKIDEFIHILDITEIQEIGTTSNSESSFSQSSNADEAPLRQETTKTRETLTRELSGGNARKLAIAVALLSPAPIVLLDEPTSSLDPDARRHVHDLIKNQRGDRTFMLCTHLLDEAEYLCDRISIMINGCLYTVGTPQYLSSIFGTDWRVELELINDKSETLEKAKNYMQETYPTSQINILRAKNIAYSIPVTDVELDQLFETLEQGIGEQSGIQYFTCSSASLENVFIDLIVKSEEALRMDTNLKNP